MHFALTTRFFGNPRCYHVSLTLLDMRVTSEMMRQRVKANSTKSRP